MNSAGDVAERTLAVARRVNGDGFLQLARAITGNTIRAGTSVLINNVYNYAYY